MHAIKLKTMIVRTHGLQIDLPADTPQGEAEVIVLVSTPDAGLHAQRGRHRPCVMSRIADSGTGAWSSTAALIAQPLQRPC